MYPELFSLPFIYHGIPSYGCMLVLGFLSAYWMAHHRCRNVRENPQHISNFVVYALLAGVIGARLFHVVHNWKDYRDNPAEIFATWSGGLEFLGGFVCALAVMFIYFGRKKLSILRFLDILAPAVMLGLAFGRMGCFLNGCCFGAPTELPFAIRFPVVNTHAQRAPGCQKATRLRYSYPYIYQLYPDHQRRPNELPLINLPADYYGYTNGDSNFSQTPQAGDYYALKNPAQLTPAQLREMTHGQFRMLAIHPAQLYSLANALIICLLLNLLFRHRRHHGQIFALMLILYGPTRFFLESLRTDSPLEFNGLTISQNLGIACFLAGTIMMILLRRRAKITTPA